MRPTPVFINHAAGGHDGGALDRIERALVAHGVAYEIRPVAPSGLGVAVRTAVEQEYPIIAVAGGDGSMRTAAQELAGSPTVLAPIPLGTLNHFARRNGSPDIDSAAGAIAAGAITPVAVGRVADHVFLSTFTAGSYAAMVERRDEMRRAVPKWVRATVAFVAGVARLDPLRLEITHEGRRIHRDTPLLWAGVGRGGFPYPHENLPATGGAELELALVRVTRRAAAYRLAFFGGLRYLREHPQRDDPRLEIRWARRVEIVADRPIDATLDGEVIRLPARLVLEIRPSALRVCTPRG